MKSSGIRVKEFYWKPGQNDAEYIRLLRRNLDEQHKLTGQAINKIREMTERYVPVVRCRYCRFYNLDSHKCQNDRIITGHKGDASFSLNFWDYDFCSFGKSREEIEQDR